MIPRVRRCDILAAAAETGPPKQWQLVSPLQDHMAKTHCSTAASVLPPSGLVHLRFIRLVPMLFAIALCLTLIVKGEEWSEILLLGDFFRVFSCLGVRCFSKVLIDALFHNVKAISNFHINPF